MMILLVIVKETFSDSLIFVYSHAPPSEGRVEKVKPAITSVPEVYAVGLQI